MVEKGNEMYVDNEEINSITIGFPSSQATLMFQTGKHVINISNTKFHTQIWNNYVSEHPRCILGS